MNNKTDPSGRSGTLLSIQYLRAFAALLVVMHHARNPQPTLFNPMEHLDFGSRGVDIFFIISGFIMYVAAREEPLFEFVRRRITRIVPLYWIAIALHLVVAIALGLVVNADLLRRTALSMFFVPHFDHHGDVYPVLVPGWTLNYEMFFYALFAIGIAFRALLPWLTMAIMVLVGGGLLLDPTTPVGITYSSPLLLEFLAGIFLGAFYRHGIPSNLVWLLPAGIGTLLLYDFVPGPPILTAGLPAAAIVTGALSWERTGRVVDLPILRLLGNASYSIYLFHIPALTVARMVLRKLPFVGFLQFTTWVVLALSISLIVGVLAHVLIEKPLLRSLSGRRKKLVGEAPAVSVVR